MAVQFILGRSGSGKTSLCIRSIADALSESAEGAPLVLLAPEQATYQAERAILADERIAGFSRLRILSFNRLQFHLCDGQWVGAEVSRAGMEMIVHKVLCDNAGGLKVFGETAHTAGLARELAQTITELHEYEKTPDEVAELAARIRSEGANDPAADKFDDIAVVYGKYLDFIVAKGGVFANPDSSLTSVRERIRGAEFLQGARLWVDGFSSFNVQQRQVLIELLRVSRDAHIALCLDPANFDINEPEHDLIDEADLFNQTRRTYADLFEIVKKCKLTLDEPVVLDRAFRFSESRALEHVERNLFVPQKPGGVSVGEDVRIVSAASSRAEVVFIARRIMELVRRENYRWRDIAVIASDLGGYQHYIEGIFEEYGIPFFIDRPRPLATHPVIELISSGLSAAAGGFGTSDVLAFLKTGLGPVGADEAAALENYCLAFGVSSGDWLSEKDWAFAEKNDRTFDEGLVNQIRRRAVAPLINLKDELAGADGQGLITAEDFVRAIWKMLAGLDVPEKISTWSEGEAGESVDHGQFYDKLVNTFDEMTDVFSVDRMRAVDLASIMVEALSGLTLKLIPSKLDQVLVGSIERSRHPNLKVVFLLGTTQRQFPIPVSLDAVVTDQDRQLAEGQGFELADRLSQRLAARQYLAYIAFTRPSGRLCITYPAMDGEGKAVARSGFVDNLASLFCDLRQESFAESVSEAEEVYSGRQLKGLLCERLGRDSHEGGDQRQVLAGLYEGICSDADEGMADAGESVRFALEYDNRARLEGGVCEKLIGKSMASSVSRLGTFAACPFRHFARYMLSIDTRKLFRFEPVDLGTFYHRVLEELYRRMDEAGKDYATVGDEELVELCREQIGRIIEGDAFLTNFKARGAHNAYILDSAARTIEDCVVAIAEMSRSGEFRQRAAELRFGGGSNMQKCEFELGDGRSVILRGSIDRVDVAETGGKQVAVVFDYKRREQSVSWARLYHGLDMQLVVYMLALQNARVGDRQIDSVAGAFYVPVEIPAAARTISGIDAEMEKFKYKAKGIVDGRFAELLHPEAKKGWDRYYNFAVDKDGEPYSFFATTGALKGEQFEDVLAAVKKRIVDFAGRIFSGEIEIRPYRMAKKSPCGNCDYSALCRFDWQINEYNTLENPGKKEVLDRIGGRK